MFKHNVLETSVFISSKCHSYIQNYNDLSSTDLWNVKYIIENTIKSREPIGNASDISLISKNCAERLKLTVFSINHRLVVLNGISLEISLCFKEFNFYLCFANNYNFLYASVVNQVKTPLFNFWLEIQTS